MATVIFENYRNLNVTPDFLTDEGITLAINGDTATMLENMTSFTPSVNLKQQVTLTINLNRASSKVVAWKKQIKNWVVLGKATVTSDSSTDVPVTIHNTTITGVPSETYNGKQNLWTVTLSGYITINEQALLAN
ncbi:putative phage protein [Lasius niger]|uniref:Putative phage protein n=1 Tax=Lasius niger TaxID=67767 RepID=A0A0J7KHU2_LASNI|nr:putative phage protein [Lasius niger]